MGSIRLAAALGCAALLLSPAAALAGFALPVNPERLNGTFDFDDRVELTKNTLEFQVQERASGIEGEVTDSTAAGDDITIRYRIDFPSKSAGRERSADVRQDRQVLVTLELVPGAESLTPPYFGQAAPIRCKARAKVSDRESNDPDDPDRAQANLTCDLGRDWSDLDDETASDPPEAVLVAVEEAFAARKDVKLDTSRGKLRIKHRGEPVE